MSERAFRVAVVGATGLVGGEVVGALAERAFPVAELRLYASEESAGTEVEFAGESHTVERLPDRMPALDVAFLCSTAAVSRKIGPDLVAEGALVIDLAGGEAGGEIGALVLNATDVGADASKRPLRVADPAARLVVGPLRALAGVVPLRRLVATIVLPASSFGRRSVEQLGEQTVELLNAQSGGGEDEETEEAEEEPEGSSLAFRCVPQEGEQTARIARQVSELLGGSTAVSIHIVRAPIFFGQLASLSVETDPALSLDDARKLLREAPSLILVEGDMAGRSTFDAIGIDGIQIMALRRDDASPAWLHFWALGDNVRQGAALPAIALAESVLLRH